MALFYHAKAIVSKLRGSNNNSGSVRSSSPSASHIQDTTELSGIWAFPLFGSGSLHILEDQRFNNEVTALKSTVRSLVF
jgi:hypothetical protein